jgi:hypothetical protein
VKRQKRQIKLINDIIGDDKKENQLSENPYRQDNPFVSDESFQEKIKRLEAENAQLLRQIHILDLSIPLEEDLQDRAYDLLARMHLPQGWSVVEVAQLIIDMQKRIAADWIEIGNLRYENNKPL